MMRVNKGKRFALSVLALGLTLTPVLGFAQSGNDSATSGAKRVAPPADLPSRPFSLPPTQTRTLPNGLKIVVVERHTVPTVTMRLAVRAGSVLNPADAPGLASAVASQMTAGTDRYTSLQLSETAENLGGSVNVSADADFATVSASGLSSNAERLADLMADVLLHPTFPESELNVYKALTLQGLIAQRQNPAFLASEQISKVLYGSHPYSVVSTTAVATQALTPDKLRAFYRERYTPQGAVLVVVGDVRSQEMIPKLEAALSGWQSGASRMASRQDYALPAIPNGRRVYLVDRPGSVQSNIVFGNLAIKRNDPDFYAFRVAETILGGSSGSRLFNQVREKSGYAYDVSGELDPRALAGDFTESAQTRTAVTAAALKEMLSLTEQMASTSVPDRELTDAKRFLTGLFVLGLTSNNGLATALVNQQMYGLPLDYLTTYRDRINAVTPADVQRVAQQYMLSGKAAIVVVGDAQALRESLKEVAPVEDVKPL